MIRAYSVLEVKSVDEEKRKFTGIASTPATDRVGDIIEPEGAQFKLPLPFLWHHNSRDPIGWIREAKVSPKGITVAGEVASVKEPGELQSRLNTAWEMIKSKLVRGLSIGFREIDSEQIDHSYGVRYKKWEWLELSAVTIPANIDATIVSVKSADDTILAALGRPNPKSSGVPAKIKEKSMKTLHEQLAEFKEARKTKAARMREIAETVKAEARDWAEAESAEFETLEGEIKQLDGDIRMKTVECMNAETAKEIPEIKGPVIWKKGPDQEEKFKGQNFTRKVIAKALAWLDQTPTDVIAERRWGKTNPTLVQIIKADVNAGSGLTSHWASDLVLADNRFTGDFLEYLYSKTVFDKLPLRQVPANVTIKGQDGASTGYWVGQGAGIPVSELTTTSVSLTAMKVAALAVITNELLRDSSPSAELLVRDSLVQAASQRIDSSFLGAGAGSANVEPAGILNGVVAVTSNGTDGAALRADIRDLYSAFITAKIASGLYLVMQPALAKAIQLLSNTLGLQEFPTINQDGGTLLGDPVVTGDNVGASDLILLRPSDIWRIADSGVEVSISKEAMIEMADNPGVNSVTPASPTGKYISLFQTESTAIKIVRSINFQKRRAAAVQFIDAASYGSSGS